MSFRATQSVLPIAPKSLFTPLCPGLGLGMLITSTLLIPWHLLADCCSLLLLGHKCPSKALHVLIMSSPCCSRALQLRLSCWNSHHSMLLVKLWAQHWDCSAETLRFPEMGVGSIPALGSAQQEKSHCAQVVSSAVNRDWSPGVGVTTLSRFGLLAYPRKCHGCFSAIPETLLALGRQLYPATVPSSCNPHWLFI